MCVWRGLDVVGGDVCVEGVGGDVCVEGVGGDVCVWMWGELGKLNVCV